MRSLQKYFLAILPPDPILQQIEEFKLEIKDQFGVKYALKSPAHITLKMPFIFDENKIERLIDPLTEKLKSIKSFQIHVAGVDDFRRKVIFWKIGPSEDLINLQQEIKNVLKSELHLTVELSDKNYHPHMTAAFRDIKKGQFDSVFSYVDQWGLEALFLVNSVYLLKKVDGIWKTEIPIKLDSNR